MLITTHDHTHVIARRHATPEAVERTLAAWVDQQDATHTRLLMPVTSCLHCGEAPPVEGALVCDDCAEALAEARWRAAAEAVVGRRAERVAELERQGRETIDRLCDVMRGEEVDHDAA